MRTRTMAAAVLIMVGSVLIPGCSRDLRGQEKPADQQIAEAAAAVIVVHNHPSGNPTPSADDRAVTRQLVEAGRLLDMPVYDHVIVAGDRYFSFAEAGLL